MAERLRDLDISREELDNIGKALKNEEFRKLLVEYCEEISDPASRKQYEEEITQLEKERGIEVTFINPIAGYVIKTSVEGNKIAFVNICSNENVQQPSSTQSTKDGSRGLHWTVPHFLSPPRDDLNKRGKRCTVYDVIFHPEALNHASKTTQFRDLINSIACEAVESNYNVQLDKTNLKFPKIQFKGMFRPLVIRKKTGEPTQTQQKSDDPIDKLYAEMYEKMDENMPTNSNKNPMKVSSLSSNQNILKYATPKYLIKHRSDVDMQNYTNHFTSNINAAIPKELVVEIDLPLLKSSSDLELDVTEKTINLLSEKPSKYKLNLTLPYAVNEDDGSAKFEQDIRRLIITLPVKRKCSLLSDIGRDDSGVESDNSPTTDNSSIGDNSLPLIEELAIEDSEVSLVEDASEVYRTRQRAVSFLDPELHYSLPEYSCHSFNDILVYTLHVKNVDPTSLDKSYNDASSALHIKFMSISPGFVPIHYAFYVYLPTHSIDTDSLSIEVWDNNVIAQVSYVPTDKTVTSYWAGTSEDCAEEKLLEEPAVIFNKHFNSKPVLLEDELLAARQTRGRVQSDEDVSVVLCSQGGEEDDAFSNDSGAEPQQKPAQSAKGRCYSESSGDELSVSPTKGILKLGCSRTPVSRSVSESSIDDYTWSSFENCASVSDSLIPEESEVSSSMKKTVRFNDVVSQQLFRTNSSILGQKKKNQRKSRNKKRAQERRLSESENSEAEDKKEKFKKIPESVDMFSKETDKNNDENSEPRMYFKSDLIFDIDM